jgi:hypothetical protein
MLASRCHRPVPRVHMDIYLFIAFKQLHVHLLPITTVLTRRVSPNGSTSIIVPGISRAVVPRHHFTTHFWKRVITMGGGLLFRSLTCSQSLRFLRFHVTDPPIIHPLESKRDVPLRRRRRLPRARRPRPLRCRRRRRRRCRRCRRRRRRPPPPPLQPRHF